MSTALQNITPLNCEANLGGIIKIQVASVDDIVSISPAINGRIYDNIVFKAGRGFYTFIVTDGTPEVNANDKESDEGRFKENSLQFSVPKDREIHFNMFNEMQKSRFVVLYTDKNGKQKLLGNLNSPMQFKYDYRSGAASADFNNYQCEFFSEAPNNVAFYDADVTAAPGTPVPAIVEDGAGNILALLNSGDTYTLVGGFSQGFRIT